MSINNVTLTGRLTAEPEIRSTNSGKEIASFTLALDDGFGENKKTFFFDCKAWESIAKVLSQCTKKGSKIAVSGKLNQESWEKDGQKRTKVVILVRELELLDSKPKTESTDSDNDNEFDYSTT